MDGQGNLERTWKVREKSGNLKINGYGRHTSENLFTMFKRGKDVLSQCRTQGGAKGAHAPRSDHKAYLAPRKKS